MIHEPMVEVECDKCGHRVSVEPEYKYHSYSGRSGQYDFEFSSLQERMEFDLCEKWSECDTGEYEHLCESCTEELQDEEE